MTPLTIVDHPEFVQRYAASINATARGDAPPFGFGRRWRPDGLVCVLDDGAGAIGVKVPGKFDPFEQAAGHIDQDEATRTLALFVDARWLELQAKRQAGAPLGNDTWLFHLWGSVCDLLRPWIETGEHLSPAVLTEADSAWAETQSWLFQMTLRAFPEIAAKWARERGRVLRSPGPGAIVDLASVRSARATKH